MSNIQTSINIAAKELTDAFNNHKTAKQSLKELRQDLKNALSEIPAYLELEKKEKELKKVKKDITEELAEIKKSKEQIAMETDEQKELDDFVEETETKFLSIRDRVIVQLSRELADEGMVAEIQYKNGQLILVVARA